MEDELVESRPPAIWYLPGCARLGQLGLRLGVPGLLQFDQVKISSACDIAGFAAISVADGYDFWVDYASLADDGMLGSQSSYLRSGLLGVIPGAVITVGSEGGGRPAQVVYVDIGSAIVVQVRPA